MAKFKADPCLLWTVVDRVVTFIIVVHVKTCYRWKENMRNAVNFSGRQMRSLPPTTSGIVHMSCGVEHDRYRPGR